MALSNVVPHEAIPARQGPAANSFSDTGSQLETPSAFTLVVSCRFIPSRSEGSASPVHGIQVTFGNGSF